MPSQNTSNFTKKIHHAPYETISPTRAPLSQAGRNILVTGASGAIGRAIAKNFGLAHAATVILVARTLDTLQTTLSELQDAAKAANSPTKYLARQADIADPTSIKSLFDNLASDKIHIDVLINNAAKMSPMGSIFALGPEEVWSQFEANVHGPLILTTYFHNQPSLDTDDQQNKKKKKYLVNVSTQAIHMLNTPTMVGKFPAYSLTKQSGNSLFSYLANEVDPESDMQIINFHPGGIFNSSWARVPKDLWPEFDDDDLPGQFAVWASSDEALPLHCRFVWAGWDLEEILDREGPIRAFIEGSKDFLTVGVVGLGGNDWDDAYKPEGY